MSAPATLAPPRPQVNLLPPEVRSARTVSRVKQWMLVAVGIALVVVAGGYGYSVLEVSQANEELDSARATTTALLAEQQKYAEVPVVLSELANAEQARYYSLQNEILWETYLGAVHAVLGDDMSIDTAAVSRLDPAETPEPLDERAQATLTVVGRTLELPNVPGLIEDLDAVPGFTNTRIDVAELTVEGDSEPYYEVTTTIRVTAQALSGRGTPTAEEE